MSELWSVPRLWPGATVVCLAGGPSLDLAQVRRVAIARREDRIRAIAINDACYPAFWADVLYACDWRWWKKHEGVPSFKGLKITISNSRGHVDEYPEIRIVENTGTDGLEIKPTGIRTGRNSGYQAINLCLHFGAKRIVLLGYDLKLGSNGEAHWFGDHEDWQLKQRTVDNVLKPAFNGLAKPLRKLGIQVLNCTPGSALEVFPKMELEKVL